MKNKMLIINARILGKSIFKLIIISVFAVTNVNAAQSRQEFIYLCTYGNYDVISEKIRVSNEKDLNENLIIKTYFREKDRSCQPAKSFNCFDQHAELQGKGNFSRHINVSFHSSNNTSNRITDRSSFVYMSPPGSEYRKITSLLLGEETSQGIRKFFLTEINDNTGDKSPVIWAFTGICEKID